MSYYLCSGLASSHLPGRSVSTRHVYSTSTYYTDTYASCFNLDAESHLAVNFQNAQSAPLRSEHHDLGDALLLHLLAHPISVHVCFSSEDSLVVRRERSLGPNRLDRDVNLVVRKSP